MNRTQRAVKKACHKALDYAKKQKKFALLKKKDGNYGFWYEYKCRQKKSEELKEAAANEKGLKKWHRKMVQDYAVNTLKEDKTA